MEESFKVPILAAKPTPEKEETAENSKKPEIEIPYKGNKNILYRLWTLQK